MRTLASTTLLLLMATALPACGQNSAGNARVLKPYLVPQQVTRLDWELLQFNILWSGSYTGQGSYCTSYPVFFDTKAMRFRTFVGVNERRDYQDPEPWSALSRLKRESLLREVVEKLTGLLQQSFPEIKNKPELVFIEFKYRPTGGAFVNVARYENGTLVLAE